MPDTAQSIPSEPAESDPIPPGAPPGGWMQGIDDIYLGRWVHPLTGEAAPRAAVELIEIADSLDGAEAELARAAGIRGRVALVADPDTWDAVGARIARALRAHGFDLEEAVLPVHTHASLPAAAALAGRIAGADTVVAVGSGTVNDLVKHTTAKDGRPYAVFGTAPSMDGYASQTASITLENGLKASLPAHSPNGVFLDLAVFAAAPAHMAAAGFGDCICSSVARIDWWMSHRLLGTPFRDEPYEIMEEDSRILRLHADGIGRRDRVALGYLARSLVLSGLGVNFTGVSNHGSMGEHQISHYIDCFAGSRHPGTLHGQQVGVASLSMGRIQQCLLERDSPPILRPTRVDSAGMANRMGSDIGSQCEFEYRKKALDEAGADRMNERLQAIWPSLQTECRQWIDPVADMRDRLKAAGAPTTTAELGIPTEFYREAVRHGHEMRNRFSFADLASDAGLLDEFAAAET